MKSPVAGRLALGLAVTLLAASANAQSNRTAPEWRGCCGLMPWAQAGPINHNNRASSGSPLTRGYGYIRGGSALRHNLGVNGQIPAGYLKLRNPLPPTAENAQRGAAVYEAQCSSCHGATGLGDGQASQTLSPRPAQLAWILKVPTKRRDPFMYWSIVDGGQKFGTAMPSYQGKLSHDEIWSVIGYIDARLPEPDKKP